MADGNFVILSSNYNIEWFDPMVIMLTPMGAKAWLTIIDPWDEDILGYSIASSTDNQYLYIAGYSAVFGTANDNDGFLMRLLASDGTKDWVKTYGEVSGGSTRFHSLLLKDDGNLLAGGYHNYGSQGNDILLFEFTPDGAQV